MLQLEEAAHLASNPAEYCPVYPLGSGDLSLLQPSAEEPPTKKARTSGGEKHSGTKTGPISPRKYRQGIPDKSFPLLNRTFEQFYGSGGSEFSRWLYAARSRATWSKYESALRVYKKFLVATPEPVFWPTSESEDEKFIFWLAKQRNLSASTIEGYFRAIKTLQIDMGLEPSGSILGRSRIKTLMQGIKNTRQVKHFSEHEPITLKSLREIRHRLIDTDWPEPVKTTFWTGCLVAFFGAFRLSEIFASGKRNFDVTSDLIWEDLSWMGKFTVRIRVKKPKANQGAESVELFRFGKKNFCPVRHLKKLADRMEKGGGVGEKSPYLL